MTARFFITIDTEEDDWGEYRSSGFSLDAVRQLSRVQEIFDAYGAIPTYLVTYPVVKEEDARGFFVDNLGSGRCEIGTHCHPWNTPPFVEELNERHSMLCNLPYSVVRDKIATLRDEISKSLGVVPVCFRSGRWGFGPDVARALIELGFRVDTSVTPYVDWATSGGPDYRGAPTHAYHFRPDEILTAAPNGSLLEVPVTIGFLQGNEAFGRRAIAAGRIARKLHIRGILDVARIVNLRWLSPELSTAREMIALAKRELLRKCTYLNMSFHSTTLLPGKTPFVRTAQDLEEFLRRIDALVKFVASEGVVFSGLADSLKAA
jgi:hypothetical protein